MGVYYEDIDITAIRMAVLVAILIFGIAGNILAIITNMKSFRKNRLNGVLYLHLGVVDFVLCLFHSVITLLSEGVGYYSLNNDLGRWGGFLKVLVLDIGLRCYFSFGFISAMSLTFIAILRCWRMFHPFGVVRTRLLLAGIGLFDVAAVVVVALMTFSERELILPGNMTLSQTWDDESDFANGSGLFTNSSRYGMLSEVWANDASFDDRNSSSMQNTFGVTKATKMNFAMNVFGYCAFAFILVVTLCYVLICVKMHTYRIEMEGVDIVQKAQFLKRQTKNLVTQVILLVLFILTQGPVFLHGYFVVVSFALSRLLISVSVINNAINPYVYCVLLPANRQKIRRFFSCKGTMTAKCA